METVTPAAGNGALDLPAAAARYFDASMWLTLGAALLVSTAAFIVMRWYVRALFRESQRSASLPEAGDGVGAAFLRPGIPTSRPLEIRNETPRGSASAPPARSPAFRHAQTAFRRAALFYALAGCAYAATSTGLLFLFGAYGLPSTPSRLTMLASYAAVFWSWSSITVVALALFFGPHRRVRWLLILGYLSVLPAAGVLLKFGGAAPLPFADVGLMPEDEAILLLAFASAVMEQPVSAETVTFSPLSQPVVFWSLSAAPVLLPLLTFNRFIRGTVGPLFLVVALLLVLSTFVILDSILYTAPGVWLVQRVRGMFGGSSLVVLIMASFALSAIAGWFGLRWIVNRYRRKQSSDQTFLFDALWLSVSLWACVYLMGNGGHVNIADLRDAESVQRAREDRRSESRLNSPPLAVRGIHQADGRDQQCQHRNRDGAWPRAWRSSAGSSRLGELDAPISRPMSRGHVSRRARKRT